MFAHFHGVNTLTAAGVNQHDVTGTDVGERDTASPCTPRACLSYLGQPGGRSWGAIHQQPSVLDTETVPGVAGEFPQHPHAILWVWETCKERKSSGRNANAFGWAIECLRGKG